MVLGQLDIHTKTEKFRFLPHNIHRINLKWTMHLNVNIGENLHDPELGK